MVHSHHAVTGELNGVDADAAAGQFGQLPLGDGQENPIADEAEHVEGWFSVTSLLRFRPCLRSLRLKQFVINVEYDIDQDQWNLRTINLSGPGMSGAVPFVFADQGTLRLRRIRDGRIEPIVVLGVSGSFGPVSGQPDRFSYFLGVDDRLGFGGKIGRAHV